MESGTTAQILRSYVERIERLSEEKKALGNDISDIFREAKSKGFDVKAMKRVIKLRNLDSEAKASETEIADVYMGELGNG